MAGKSIASTARRFLSSSVHVAVNCRKCTDSSSTAPSARRFASLSSSSIVSPNCVGPGTTGTAARSSHPNRPTRFVSSAAKTTSTSSTDAGDDYVSPYSDFFDAIARGRTTLGTHASQSYGPAEPVRYLKCGIPESVLRFRTVSYGRSQLEPFVQPGEYKVMLKVNAKHVPLETDLEREIFCQIVGRRYIPEKNELRLTSNQFASRIENKRHLVSMLDRIVINTKRLAREAAAEREAA